MERVRLRALVAGACLSSVALVTTAARADVDDAQRAAARGFATDGLAAFNAGQFDKAIDLFTRAEALVHAPPHLLYIARASAKTGKLVRAKELYVKIAREELAPSAPKAFTEAQASAVTEQAELEPRIPKLTITLEGPGAEGASVTMDGAPVPAALIGASQPADPGVHKLRATALGWKAADAEVQLAERGSGAATLTLDQPAPRSEPVAASPASKGEEPSALRRISPFIGFGVGAIGVAVGTVFVLKNRADRDEADQLCPDGRCPLSRQGQIRDLDESADQAQTLAWIGYGVGAAGIAAGTLLLLANRSATSSKPTTGWTMTPWLSAGSAGVRGRF